MASNYVDLYHNVDNDTMTEQEGLELHGRDGVYCTSPLYTDIPLLTESQSVAEAINELKKDLDEGGGGWSPPEEWPEVPEPSGYEICLLVSIDEAYNVTQAVIDIARPADGYQGYGPVTVDWGDGTVESWEGRNENDEGTPWSAPLNHTYTTYGLYVIKITTSEHSCWLRSQYKNPNWLIAKLGSQITVYGTGSGFGFQNQSRLQYIKMSGKDGLSPYCFNYCYALCRVDIDIPPASIPASAFTSCRSLKSFDFSKVTTISGSAALGDSGFASINMPFCTAIPAHTFQNCFNLKSVNAPLCTYADDYCYMGCFMLSTLVLAEQCTFGEHCFNGCFSLYPYRDT